MDIIKFTNPTAPTKMEYAEIINGIKTKEWIERYLEAGEFTFKAPASSGIMRSLPIGSYISHTNTTEIMIVENHELNANHDAEPDVTVTGRSFETILDRRVVAANKTMPEVIINASGDFMVMAGMPLSYVATDLIEKHIVSAYVIRPGDAIPYVSVVDIVPSGGSSGCLFYTLPPKDLYLTVLDLLKVDTLGIKSVRPMYGHGTSNVELQIHKGVDRRDDLIFSYDMGDIVSADYFWSKRTLKNAAFVRGTWVDTYIGDGSMNAERRILFVEAKDVDASYTSIPTPAEEAIISAQLQQRGVQELMKQRSLTLTKVEPAKNGIHANFREDYDLGDIVTVAGDYNETSVMRVTEHVEIEDAEGDHGYPTLAALEEAVIPE